MADDLKYKPKYLMVMDHIRKDIASGKYSQGNALPSQLKLTKQYGVALGTVRQSLAGLANEGWIKPEPGRGFFVQTPQGNNGLESTDHATSRIGFVWWYDISNETIARSYVTTMHAAAVEARKSKVELVYAQFNPKSDEDNEKLARFIAQLEGVIVTGKVDVAKLYDIAKSNSSKVVIAGQTLGFVDDNHFSLFAADVHSAGYLAVQHLLGFGHRRLALVNESGSTFFSGIQNGVEHACKHSGLPEPKVYVVNDVQNEVDVQRKIEEAADEIARDLDTTGIIVTANVNAEAMIYRLSSYGCSVPDTKSVVSVSGTPRGEMVLKDISQIRVPCDQIGVECVKFLLSNSDKTVYRSLPVRIEHGQTVLSLNLPRADRETERSVSEPLAAK